MLPPDQIADVDFPVAADVRAALVLLRDHFSPTGARDSRGTNNSRQPVRMVCFGQGQAEIAVALNKRKLSLYMRNETLDGRRLTDLLPASMVEKLYLPGDKAARSVNDSPFMSPARGIECLRLAPHGDELRRAIDAFFGRTTTAASPSTGPASLRIRHSRVQHAVGQGSFHSACVQVQVADGGCYRYDYVFDCGALSGRWPTPQLKQSISHLGNCLTDRSDSAGQKVINTVVLSHYDQDHINGASLLASAFKVRRIVVPYLGEDELMLVLSAHAMSMDDDTVAALHALANGQGDLFGVPVTQVLPGTFPPDQAPPTTRQDAARNPDAVTRTDGPLPGDLLEVEEGTGQLVGSSLPAGQPLSLGTFHPLGGMSAAWRLKFWNRSVPPRLVNELRTGLTVAGFPLAALSDRQAGAQTLAKWLDAPKGVNRKRALKAYAGAIAAVQPGWAKSVTGQRLSNFLSLCLYAGPASASPRLRFAIERHPLQPFPALQRRWPDVRSPLPRRPLRIGWLGTGDAPLGEHAIWNDLQAHFAHELPTVRTVQVPHHGAAPHSGPKFFHPGLIVAPGVRAVVSAGMDNIYGHPRPVVMNAALMASAQLEIVTEDSHIGFCELFGFDA